MWSEEDDERDLPQAMDLEEDDDGDYVVDCLYCGQPIHEDAPRCPHCGQWQDAEHSPATRRAGGWFWPVMVALLVAVILVMWMGLGRW